MLKKRMMAITMSVAMAVCGLGNISLCGVARNDVVMADVAKTDVNAPNSGTSDLKTLAGCAGSEVVLQDAYEVNAYNKEIEYLKSLDADRLLKGFMTQAGLKSNAALYEGWESMAIKGHTLGHYMSAMAQAYAYSGDADILNSLNHVCEELEKAQKDTGYLAAIPESHYTQIENGKTDGTWVPWYTMHKVLAGLVSTYENAHIEKALTIASKLGDWVYGRTSTWNEATQNRVLSVEYGGMNDVMYELYSLTGNSKHLDAAHSFDEKKLFESLYNNKDVLDGLHANTTIPKIIGALNRYVVLGEKESEAYYLTVAKNFWDIVISHHTYITGGNSEWEHFGKADVLDKERTECTCETCNTYNMLKLSRTLFELTHDVKYADYYENTFINAILSSQNPETGMTTYFQPMATGYFKVYSTPTKHFWCCTGSGMENFTKLEDSIYFKGNKEMYVIQYMDSTVTWADRNLKLVQESNIPDSDTTEFTVNAIDGKSVDVALMIRIPDWVAGNIEVKFNGKDYSAANTNGYARVEGPFNNGDKISVKLPMKVVAYNLQDNKKSYALKYGPIVLSASLGNEKLLTSTTGVNVTVPLKGKAPLTTIHVLGSLGQWINNVNDNVVKTEGKLEFTLKNTDADSLVFTPHYLQHTDRYGLYFLYSDGASNDTLKNLQQAKLDGILKKRTVDSVPVSNDQYELQHKLVSKSSSTGSFDGLMYRDATNGGYFQYTFKVDPNEKQYLVAKYYNGDGGRRFKIYADDTMIADVTLQNIEGKGFYDVQYEIPKSITNGKNEVTIKFVAGEGSFAGGIFENLVILKEASDDAGISVCKVNDEDISSQMNQAGEKTSYAYVDEDATEATLLVTPSAEYASVYINGKFVDETKPYTVKLTDKETKVNISVSAEDGKARNVYYLTIVKEKKADDKLPVMKIVIIVVSIVAVIAVAVCAIIIMKKKKKKNDGAENNESKENDGNAEKKASEDEHEVEDKTEE